MNKSFALLLATFITASVFCQNNNESRGWAKAEALNKAVFETKDSVAISSLLAETATYGHSTGLLEDKPAMIRNAVSNPDNYKNISFERLSATPAGNAIIVRYILRANQVKSSGESAPLNLSIIQVWAKEKGQLRLFARQAVKIAPK
jgi:hypothetical protein